MVRNRTRCLGFKFVKENLIEYLCDLRNVLVYLKDQRRFPQIKETSKSCPSQSSRPIEGAKNTIFRLMFQIWTKKPVKYFFKIFLMDKLDHVPKKAETFFRSRTLNYKFPMKVLTLASTSYVHKINFNFPSENETFNLNWRHLNEREKFPILQVYWKFIDDPLTFTFSRPARDWNENELF